MRARQDPSRRERITQLFSRGVEPPQISRLEGVSIHTVHCYVTQARKDGILPPSPKLPRPPELTDRVAEVMQDGRTLKEVLQLLPDTRRSSVTVLYYELKRAQRAGLFLPADIREALRPYAEARGLGIADVARELVEAVIDLGMVEQLLDDGADV